MVTISLGPPAQEAEFLRRAGGLALGDLSVKNARAVYGWWQRSVRMREKNASVKDGRGTQIEQVFDAFQRVANQVTISGRSDSFYEESDCLIKIIFVTDLCPRLGY